MIVLNPFRRRPHSNTDFPGAGLTGLLLLLIVVLSSCVVAPDESASYMPALYSFEGKVGIILPVEDHRDAMSRDHFPEAVTDVAFILNNELRSRGFLTTVKKNDKSGRNDSHIRIFGYGPDSKTTGLDPEADFLVLCKLDNYSWSDTAYILQMVDSQTGELLFHGSYTDEEPLWVPLFLSRYHPYDQFEKSVANILEVHFERTAGK